MARVCSTTRPIIEGEAPDTIDMAPISKVMKATTIAEPKVTKEEDALEEGGSNAEVASNEEEDDIVLWPNKPSHIEFGQSIVKPNDLDVLKRLRYIGEKEDDMIRFARGETILEPKNDEVVVFKSFFRTGLRFIMYKMIDEVLKSMKYLYMS